MRIPISWLAEYADLPAGTTPEALHAALVRVGFEDTVSVLAIVMTPPRRLSGSCTLRNSLPKSPGMP